MEIVIVPVISTLVYLLMQGYKKYIAKNREKYMQIIPVISGGLGAIISVILYFVEPTILPTTSIATTLLVGIASGLSATGFHQIVKQLSTKE